MKPKPAPVHVGKMLAIGTKVAVLRPNLWTGAVGKVVRYDSNETHKHWVKLVSKDGDYGFHALATIEELKEINK